MNHLRLAPTYLLWAVSLAMCACSQSAQQAQAPDTRAADETAIRAASADWSKAAQAKDLDKCVAPFADDAIAMYPKMPLAQGKDNIRKGWQETLAMPGPGLSFTTTGVEVARSGDIAWEHGTYEMSTADKKGKVSTEKGKYVTVWKKQADGSWKVAADIDNADE